MNTMSAERHLLLFHPLGNERPFTVDRNLMTVTMSMGQFLSP